jgi:tetratricopeptide (TPR) repeat protein
MSADSTPSADSVVRAREVDALCDRFEAALCRGTAGDLADWLPPFEPLRGLALFELVRLELEHRQRAGEAARAEEYLARYPELAADPARAARLRATDPGAGLPTPPTTLDSTGMESGQPAAEGSSDPAGMPAIPGYEILEELGHGGMGVVLRGRDVDLDRDVAVKVLREKHTGRPELARRFLEEARISGQLQHPGIVPVYELGTFHDHRAYFTMKLVKGRTLAQLLDDRKAVAEERPRFLGIFAQVCQTLAYAHARGVIHRDLKPANVMVGAFGEVQVMDWGLAKVLLAEGAEADAEHGPQLEHRDTVRLSRTQRSQGAARQKDAGAYTQEGFVLGTPAYMAPEQARGDVDLVDERADVFGLGAILCEILTGQPPFPGKTAEAHRKAQAAQLDDAQARLDGCGADTELVTLARRCLAADPGQRPRHAGEVAEAVTAYQNAVAERLRQAELGEAEARARVEEERKTRAEAEARLVAERRARRRTVQLAAALLLGTMGLGAGGLWVQQQRVGRLAEQARVAAETQRDVQAAVQEAEAHAAQARSSHDDPPRWQAALAAALSAAKRAEGVLNAGVATDELRAQVDALQARLAQQERDRQLAAELEQIRLFKGETRDGAFDFYAALPRYAAAFARYGLDVAAVEPAKLAEKLQEHPVREQLLVALREWALYSTQEDERQRLAAVLAAAEPALTDLDRQWRAACRARNRATLERLAEGADPARLPAATLVQLAKDLDAAGASAAAARLLRRAQPRYPADFWLNHDLGTVLLKTEPPEPAAAVSYLRAALALRPRSPGVQLNLGNALRAQGDRAGALAAFREALRLDPTYATAHNNLGNALKGQGDLAGAVAAYRQALRFDPKSATAIHNLGVALHEQGDPAGVVAACREALRRDPGFAAAYSTLGNALRAQGDLAGAVAACREALRLDPKYAVAHNNLGYALYAQKDLAGAVAAFREALRLNPKYARAHYGLGRVLEAQKDFSGAAAAYREALRLDPKFSKAHNDLGNALKAQGDRAGAEAAYRRALRLDPKDATAHYNLGLALAGKNDLTGAVAAYREALRLDPKFALAHYNLGIALYGQKDVSGAVASFRTALRLDPKYARAHYNLGKVLHDQGDAAGAMAAYREALRLDPRFAMAHCNLGQALREQGQFAAALEALRRGHELGTQQPGWRYPSAQWVHDAERLVALEARLPDVLAGKARPADAAEGLACARVCRSRQQHAAAAHFYAEAFAADLKLADNLDTGDRSHAACCAARAAAAKILPDKTVLGLRRQALAWLRADLARYAKLAESDDPAARQAVQRTMRLWQQEADLAPVRTREALDQLPDTERMDWRQLWEDVEQLLRRAAVQD